MEIDSAMWDSFAKFKIACRNNRVFPECDFLNMLIAALPQLTLTIEPGTQFFRARIYKNSFDDLILGYVTKIADDVEHGDQYIKQMEGEFEKVDTQRKAGFKGYDEKGSFVCPDLRAISSGRCNYANEQCLYISEDVSTAISEMKPLIREEVSVACIEVVEPLKIVDFSFDSTESKIKKTDCFPFHYISDS